MGMEYRQQNVRLSLVIQLSVDNPPPWNQLVRTIINYEVVLYRGFGTNIDLLNGFVGQHEGKIIELFENSESNVTHMNAFTLRPT